MMKSTACGWCENTGGNVTPAGNVEEWAEGPFAEMLANRVTNAGNAGGMSFLESLVRLRRIAWHLRPEINSGEASEWLADFVFPCPQSGRTEAETVFWSLLILLPYPVLRAACVAALDILDERGEGTLTATGCPECRFEGCYECCNGGRG